MRPIYVRSDFHVCPNPLSADSYSICEHSCGYCMLFPLYHSTMKNTYKKGLLPTNLFELEQILKTAFGTRKDSDNDIILALRANLPVILGRKCEPFCPSERKKKNTETMLKLFHDFDVPVIPEVKNLNINRTAMEKYASGILVSIMPAPFDIHQHLEPGLPHPFERFKFAKEMKDLGLFVGITGEPLMVPPPPNFYDEYAQHVKECGADHVNFGEFRTNNPTIPYQRMKQQGYNLKDFISYTKKHWIEMATSFVDAIRKVGVKVSTPDWVNFGQTNDCLGCCGLSDKFNYHKFNFQYATMLLKEKNKITLFDISKYNIFGEKYSQQFKYIWNNPKKYFSLADVKGITSLGLDHEGNQIYGKSPMLNGVEE